MSMIEPIFSPSINV